MIRMVRQIQMRWITFSCAILLVASVILSSGVSSVNAETTDQTLKDTQSKQEELAEQIANMEKVISQLSASQNELDGKLDWLNSRNAEQKALYMEKTQQLAAALKSMEAANQEYLDAEKNWSVNKKNIAVDFKSCLLIGKSHICSFLLSRVIFRISLQRFSSWHWLPKLISS